MKIVIATPVDYNNYGNRLQNYAVHKICEKLNLTPYTIVLPKKIHGLNMNSLIRLIRPFRKLLSLINIRCFAKLLKVINFYLFTNDNIACIECPNKKSVDEVITNADYVGVGGDQIWSKYWSSRLWYCGFDEISSDKKICFAPSFGKAKLSKLEVENIREKIQNIDKPAVRELSGVDLFYSITGKKAIQIIDPVLMLSKQEWLAVARYNNVPNNKFVLTYFLGNSRSVNELVLSIASRIADGNVLNLMDLSKPRVYTSDPSEFIGLISKAEFVVTDSYHGILMCIVLNVPFVVCNRDFEGADMSTRIDSLVKLFHIENNLLENFSKEESLDKSLEILKSRTNYDRYVDEYRNIAWNYYSSFIDM